MPAPGTGAEPPQEEPPHKRVLCHLPHMEHLLTSGLTEGWVRERMPTWYSVDGPTAQRILRWPTELPGGILIEYPGSGGYCRIRLDEPIDLGDGKQARYLAPRGSHNRLYIPQYVFDLAEQGAEIQRLVITEGEKKAEALCSIGVPAIAVAGVWCWRTRYPGEQESRPLKEWEQVGIQHIPEVQIVWDSDARKNENVAEAGRQLADYLTSLGVKKVRVRYVPGLRGVRKVGIDDYIVRAGKDAALGWLDGADRDETQVRADERVQIDKVYKLRLEDDPLWVVVLSGRPMRLTTEQITSWTQFARAVFAQTSKFPVIAKKNVQQAWVQILNELCSDPERYEELPVPPDLTLSARVMAAVHDYCDTRASTHTEDLATTAGVVEQDGVYFVRPAGLQAEVLRRVKDLRSAGDLWLILREQGAEYTRVTVNKRQVRVWSIPIPEDGPTTAQQERTPEEAKAEELIRQLGII